MWDEITYPFPYFNGVTVEVWEWISNLIPHYQACYYLSVLGLKSIHVRAWGLLKFRGFFFWFFFDKWHVSLKHSQGLLLPCINMGLFGKIPGTLPGNSSSCTPRDVWIILLYNGSTELKALWHPMGTVLQITRVLSICYKYCRTTRKCVAFGKKLYWFGYKTQFPVRTGVVKLSKNTSDIYSQPNIELCLPTKRDTMYPGFCRLRDQCISKRVFLTVHQPSGHMTQ